MFRKNLLFIELNCCKNLFFFAFHNYVTFVFQSDAATRVGAGDPGPSSMEDVDKLLSSLNIQPVSGMFQQKNMTEKWKVHLKKDTQYTSFFYLFSI